MASGAEKFKNIITNSFKYRVFTLQRLPMAWLAGLKVASLDEKSASVTIRYGYLTQNPFRSLYFACLAMAAELSTGVLAMMHVFEAKPSISMLVVGMKAEFTKKAVGKITFVCTDGDAIAQAIAESKATGEGRTVTILSKGTDEAGDTVAEFWFTWSFKAKKA
ncbi:protein of unknown function [Flexibacter flexilis DSM 6793]|uniref:Acyl-coenzyme A thioesterase PaaI, contains HGG motif n=1 Tax=Flexibacter flexilis DSM 6793 TaxID=927664 RepID=A0A1I1EDS7_9BACT|nr:DUF4442 domain-containing protein [Flexibacter flexilis]SFB85265.1 protein of unknown function [Flexibacter flexilis DSM 6793]